MMFNIQNCPKQISKITMVGARNWYSIKGNERNNTLKRINTFLFYDEKHKRCILQFNRTFENADLMFIIEFSDGSFADVRTFRINNFRLTRSLKIQCSYKDKEDLIKNSKAFEFMEVKDEEAIKFTNVQFDNMNNLCYGLVRLYYYQKTRRLETKYF